MVFPSLPIYLDPPNWQQQQQNQAQAATGDAPQLQPPAPPVAAAGPGSSSIRPGSMAERARLAKIPQPDAALKCPRCDSTNTKFCYFNNYSLLQPRHFCKTCRRYWTRGGALRNVPVGGGCRRNKRSKSGGTSKSPASSDRQTGSSTSTGAAATSSSSSTVDMLAHIPPPLPHLPFMPPLQHHLPEYGTMAEIGLNFHGLNPPVPATAAGGGTDMEYHMGGGSSSSATHAMFSAGPADQWRLQQLQQFPFLSGLEPPPSALYPFDGEAIDPPAAFTTGNSAHQFQSKPSSSVATQLASVKIEENRGLNLSRSFLGIPASDQYWAGNAWTDLSNFTSSSSTSHLL